MSVPEDAVSRLLEEGQEIPEDPVEIERLLSEQDDAPDPDDDATPADDKPSGEGDDKEDDPTDDDKTGEPPAVLLRTYRQSLHEADEQLKARDEELEGKNEEIEKLQGKLALALSNTDTDRQDLQDKVDDVTDDGVKIEDLTPERIAEIREEAGDEVADQLEAYSKQFSALDGRLKELEEANEALQEQREAAENQGLMNDLDSVPLLSVLAAARGDEADERWTRTLNYEKAVRADPDWSDKSRREVYEEVGRRMEGYLGEEAVKALVGTIKTDDESSAADDADKTGKESSSDEVIDEALKRADESALPTSLSDLPAGQSAPGSENERAQAMSLVDVETAIEKAFEKGGAEAVDEALSKFMTMDQ